jgi:hypothetical protein
MTSISNLVENSISRSQSILNVKLKSEQNFGKNEIKKLVVPFKREEDMILLCLSNFLHDFVHDYNLSSMHKRVIKGDSYGLLQSLKIGINNPTFKIFAYESSTHGEPELYDDSKFEDVPSDPYSKPLSYLEYFNENKLEVPIQHGGKDPHAIKIKPFQINENNNENDNDSEKTNQYYEDEDDINLNKFKLKPNIEISNAQLSNASGVISYNESLIYPLNSTLNSKELYNSLLNEFSNNADFLGFHSGLNTFIVSYLGSNCGKESPEFTYLYKPEMDINSDKFRNLVMYNSILCSIDCIASDFKKYSLKNSDKTIELIFLSDIFSILRLAFNTVFNKNNADLNLDPLTILNSSVTLQQFIIFYMLFLNCNSTEEFNEVLQKQSGGDGIDEEDEEELQPQPPYIVLEKTGPVEIRGYPEGVDAYYARPEKKIYLGTESIFITHNNLLTTIARGIFIKLGLWDKIFSGIDGYSKSDGTIYKFGYKEMDLISYDKLIELYPNNPWKNGNFNNELLIMQILILKNLLMEISPAKTLTFGAKIDDQLKNYLDVFYNSYFINKGQKTSNPPAKINEDALNNPNINGSIGQEIDSIFSTLENISSDDETNEYIDEEDEIENEEIIGGSGEIEMVEIKKPHILPDQNINDDNEYELNTNNEVLMSDSINKKTSFPESEIINPGIAPSAPVLFKNLKKMYQNNIYTIQNLQASRIPPINIPFGSDFITIYTLYELLTYNQTLMHRSDSQFNIPSPAFKFVINNAANIGANINGAKLLYTKKDKEAVQQIVDEVKTISDYPKELEKINQEYNSILEEINPLEIREAELRKLKRQNRIKISDYNELLKIQVDIKILKNTKLIPCENKKYLIEKIVKLNNEELLKGNKWLKEWSENCNIWFDQCQPLFGLYRNLARGTFCPTVSMMDAMFNCSLKYKATEPKEVGTMNFELKYESEKRNPETGEPDRVISFGGSVLNYTETVGVIDQLNAKIDFDLICIDAENQVKDVANISTIGIQVAESHDLKASVVYKCIIDKIKQIYTDTYFLTTEEDIASEESGIDMNNPESRSEFLKEKIDRMWSNMQIYRFENGILRYSPENFNKLLSATAIKTFGDFLQECLACIQWGGYVNSIDELPEKTKSFISENNIKPIFRSTSEQDKIIPYDNQGNALRLGLQGDRPSGFRSIYILLNGDSGINQQSIVGYMFTSANQKPTRSLLVSRGSNDDSNANTRKDKLRGKIVYVTRELPIIQEDRIKYLKSLQYKKITEKKNLIDKQTKEEFDVEIKTPTIKGTYFEDEYKMIKPPLEILSIDEPYKNANYNDWDDYETPRILSEIKKKTIVDPIEIAKLEEKAKKNAEISKEKEKLKTEKTAERELITKEAKGMKEQDIASKDFRKSFKEVTEKRNLLAKSLNPTKTIPLEEDEKRRLKNLQKKYPFPGGSKSRRHKRVNKCKISNKKNKHKHKNKTKKKRKINKKRNYTRMKTL